MSSIIQTVSFEKEKEKKLLEKLKEHLGIHKLTIVLSDGGKVEGVVSEVGKDFICLIEGDYEVIIPIVSISYFRFSH